MSEPTVVECSGTDLAKFGTTKRFSLPGDFAFPFDDAVASIRWLVRANELNTTYATGGQA